MITLYHCLSARSFRALWTIEEIGLPCELKRLPFPPRVLKPEYLEVNPLGTIPRLVDGDSRLTEPAAICQYLAVRHSPRALTVEPDEPGFVDYLNFLHFGEATLAFPLTLVLRYSRLEPKERRQPQVAEDYAKWFLARLRTLEPRLQQGEFLAAGRFTAADISVGYALMLANILGLYPRFTPAVAAYWKRLRERPAYQAALQTQERAAKEQGVPASWPAKE